MDKKTRGTMPYAQYLFGPGYRSSAIRQAARGWIRREENRFALHFFALGFLAWLLYAGFASSFDPVKVAMTQAIVSHANVLGLGASAEGEMVSFGGGAYVYLLTLGCTGIFLNLLFAAAVLAYPTTGMARAIGLAMGIPLLVAVNHVRLLSLGWLGLHHPRLADSAHDFWWQAVLVVVTGLAWLAWLRVFVEPPKGRSRIGGMREILHATGVCVLVMGILTMIGIWTNLDEVYGGLGSRMAMWLAPSVVGGANAAPFVPSVFSYGVLCSMIALFLAAPRASAAAKLKGAATWGVLVCVAVHVILSMAVLGFSEHPSTAWIGFALTAYLIVPMAAWYTWMRRNALLPSVDAARRLACPECGRLQSDLLHHVRQTHGMRSRRMVRSIVRAHPELATLQGGTDSANKVWSRRPS